MRRTLSSQYERYAMPEPNCGCWLWAGPSWKRGYGIICGEGKKLAAHRYAYSTFIGSIPDGFDVCHSCDIPLCVWPGHLFLGTAKDNIQDAIKKGRFTGFPRVVGEAVTGAKLSERDVRAMRELWAAGTRQKEIASKFGIAVGTVRDALSGRTWAHVR